QFNSLLTQDPGAMPGQALAISTSDFGVLEGPEYDPNCVVDPEQYANYPEPDFVNVWNRLRAGFTLEYTHNPRIDNHRDWYARNPTYMKRVSERAVRYLYGIVEKIEERGMPLELALLPIVESAFDPFAYSHGRASGMWQFIPETGLHYGLKQNWWRSEERRVGKDGRAGGTP